MTTTLKIIPNFKDIHATKIQQKRPSAMVTEKNPAPVSNSAPSACRLCQFYQSEGRQGGYCQKMGTFVCGRWQACQLARPLFTAR